MNIAPENLRMVEAARRSAPAPNSPAAAAPSVGLYHSGRQYQELVDALARIRCTVMRPMIYEA